MGTVLSVPVAVTGGFFLWKLGQGGHILVEDPEERVVCPRLFPSSSNESKPTGCTGCATAPIGSMDGTCYWSLLIWRCCRDHLFLFLNLPYVKLLAEVSASVAYVKLLLVVPPLSSVLRSPPFCCTGLQQEPAAGNSVWRPRSSLEAALICVSKLP